MRQHWRDPRYWRWLWERSRNDAVMGTLIVLLAVCGFLLAGALSPGSTADSPVVVAGTSERLRTVVRTIDGKTETEVVTQTQAQSGTVTETGDTRLVTVVRDGKAVALRVPGKTVTDTVTVRLPGKKKVVTNTRTDTVTQTQTQTNTVDRPTTTTDHSTTTVTKRRRLVTLASRSAPSRKPRRKRRQRR